MLTGVLRVASWDYEPHGTLAWVLLFLLGGVLMLVGLWYDPAAGARKILIREQVLLQSALKRQTSDVLRGRPIANLEAPDTEILADTLEYYRHVKWRFADVVLGTITTAKRDCVERRHPTDRPSPRTQNRPAQLASSRRDNSDTAVPPSSSIRQRHNPTSRPPLAGGSCPRSSRHPPPELEGRLCLGGSPRSPLRGRGEGKGCVETILLVISLTTVLSLPWG